jgi:hypothetical protein
MNFFASLELLTFAHEFDHSLWMLLNMLFMSWILNSLQFFEMNVKKLGNFHIYIWVSDYVKMFMHAKSRMHIDI